jgi:hypothetical protein
MDYREKRAKTTFAGRQLDAGEPRNGSEQKSTAVDQTAVPAIKNSD